MHIGANFGTKAAVGAFSLVRDARLVETIGIENYLYDMPYTGCGAYATAITIVNLRNVHI